MRAWVWAALLALATPAAFCADQKSAGDPPEGNGIVSWKTLAKVEEVKVNDRIVPKFSAQITALDSKEVRVQGFMMPLEPGAKQKRFLLSANVPSCPFCMPGGPDSLIEVLCKKPIAFNVEPIVVSGKLSVLSNDPTGLWYRITEAVPVP